MTVELWMLLGSALLMLALPLVYGPGFIARLGVPAMVGNRANMPDVEGWFSRAKRAHANLGEGLLPFTAIVLTAHAAGLHNWWTVTGAELFLVARVVHAVTYTVGFVPLRTPAYLAGLVGTLMIAGVILGTLIR